MYRIIALIGESGVGKDFITDAVTNANSRYHKIISCTTRPMRDNEIEGINYFFLSKEDYLNQDLLEHSEFNGWYYGTPLTSLKEDKINIGVFNPQGIRTMLDRDDIELMIYRIKTTDKTRIIRQLQREQDPNVAEVFRRFRTDTDDFKGLDFEYTVLMNNDYKDLTNAISTILANNFD